jgi:hypothetical protein
MARPQTPLWDSGEAQPRRGADAACAGSKSCLTGGHDHQRRALGLGRRVRTETENASESPVPARQRPPQFLLRPCRPGHPGHLPHDLTGQLVLAQSHEGR